MKACEQISAAKLIGQYMEAPWKIFATPGITTDHDIFCEDGENEFHSPYRQILIVGHKDTHSLNYIRGQVLTKLAQGVPILYVLTEKAVLDFVRYYCINQKDVDEEQIKERRMDTDSFNKIYGHLAELQGLPLNFVVNPNCGMLDNFPSSKLTVISDLTPLLDHGSPEDAQTKKLTALQRLKHVAEQNNSTQLILCETENKNIEEELRNEVLTVPDLTLILQETEQRPIYTLTSYHDVRNRNLKLHLAYDTEYERFIEL